jgi:hypothetical protein
MFHKNESIYQRMVIDVVVHFGVDDTQQVRIGTTPVGVGNMKSKIGFEY